MDTKNTNIIAKALHQSIAAMASIVTWDTTSYIILADLFKTLGNVTGDNEAALDDYRSEFDEITMEIVQIRLDHTKAFE